MLYPIVLETPMTTPPSVPMSASTGKRHFPPYLRLITFLLLSLLAFHSLAGVVYEDAENGDTAGWDIFDATPAGAAIENVYDADRGSRVIHLNGDRYFNGFRLRKADGNWWDAHEQATLRWSQRFDTVFTIYVRVLTEQGTRHLLYIPSDRGPIGSATAHYLLFGLGRAARDGDWHDFERDLSADLAALQPQNRLIAVQGMLIRGNGWLDDIEMGAIAPPTIRKVYVGQNASPAERHAAEELVKFLGLASGIELPIVDSLDPAHGPYFIIGTHNDYVDNLNNPPSTVQLGEDGFELRVVGDDLLIAGGSPRGTLYGVYHYLREQLGWEWYGADDPGTRPEGVTSIPIPTISEIHRPRFRYREVFSPEGGDNHDENDTSGGDFAARMMLNGQLGHRHILTMLDAHQGWGTDHLSAFNIGTESAMSAATEQQALNAVESILDNPEQRPGAAAKADLAAYATIQHTDGSARSGDPADIAFANTGEAAGAPLFDLTRRVADDLAASRPNVTLLGEAYLWSLKPPTNVTLPDNAGVLFAPIEADWSQPLETGSNQHLYLTGEPDQSIAAYLDGWSQRSDHILTWLYSTNFAGYLQPLPTVYPMIANIQALAARPEVEGIFIQDAYTTHGGSFAALHAWVYARLLWDPTQDGEQLVQQFCNGYYGPRAGPIMYRYIRALHDAATRHPGFVGTKTTPLQAYLNPDFVIHADALLAQAFQAAADNARFQRHVAIERMGIDWVMLLNGARLRAQAEQQGIDWPDSDESQRLARLDRLSDSVKNIAGMSNLAEGNASVDDVLDGLRIPRHLAARPIPCAGIATEDCVDLQELGFELADAELVGDPAASDGGAARLPGNTDIWGIQVPFQRLLPETGEWAVYARLRIDKNPLANDDDSALWMGIEPGVTKRVPIRELADGYYHTIRIDGSFRSYAGQGYLWFAPPNSSAIANLYVDRLFAIRRDAARDTLRQPCDDNPAPNCQQLQDASFELYSGIRVGTEIKDHYPDPAGGDDLDASLLAAWRHDDAASDGNVAWIARDNAHWAAQINLKTLLPRQGEWDIWAALRIEDASTGPAFRMGIWGGAGNPAIDIAPGEASDSVYQLIKLPGDGYRHDQVTDDGVVWFQTQGASLLVDRLILVPRGEDPRQQPPTGGTLTLEQASAFLARATFGPRMEEIQSLASSGNLETWIDEQFTHPASSHYAWLEHHASAPLDWDTERDNAQYVRLSAWWDIVVNDTDQLRQRVALALSEIFVVSSRGPLAAAPDGLASYYDVLVNGAFGNFRDLLLDVSRHPMMGHYLSYAGNAKAHDGSHPDENYAREIMQLFTIGLEQLNPDGSPRLGADGHPLPTYDQHDITELARVFTGWSTDDGQFEIEAGWTHESRIHPMTTFEWAHDDGEKRVLGHVIPAGQTTEEDLASAIDILFNHPNTGPFIARRLIQRLVTSNPSPDYIRRVAEAFADNGTGARGDMKAVVKAILLDPEALHGDLARPQNFGKVREPLLFLSNLWRAFHVRQGPHQLGAFRFTSIGFSEHDFLQQTGPLTALTVFNFFTPDDSPQVLANSGLVAPEMNVMGIDGLHTLVYEFAHETGEYGVHKLTAHLDLDEEIRLIDTGEFDTLLDRLDRLLLAGHMTAEQHAILREYLEYKSQTPLSHRALAQDIVALVMLSPDYAVQR